MEDTNKNEEECIICFEKLKNIAIFSCGHKCCLVCEDNMLNKNNGLLKCPCCRKKIFKRKDIIRKKKRSALDFFRDLIN